MCITETAENPKTRRNSRKKTEVGGGGETPYLERNKDRVRINSDFSKEITQAKRQGSKYLVLKDKKKTPT